MVTTRIKPMMIDGKRVYHSGFQSTRASGDPLRTQVRTARRGESATPPVYDPTQYTPEFTGFLLKVEKRAKPI